MKQMVRKILLLVLIFAVVFSLGFVAFADSPDPPQYGFTASPLPDGSTALERAANDTSAAIHLTDITAPVVRFIYPLTAADQGAQAPALDGSLIRIGSVVSSNTGIADAAVKAGSPNAIEITGKALGSADLTVTIEVWSTADPPADPPSAPDSTHTLTFTVNVYNKVEVSQNTGADAASKSLTASYGGKTASFGSLQALLDSDIVKAGTEVVVNGLALTEDISLSKENVTLRFTGTTSSLTGNITVKAAGVTVDNVTATGNILFEKENGALLHSSAASAAFQGGGTNKVDGFAASGALTFANPASAQVTDGNTGSLVLKNLTLTGLSSGFGWQNGVYSAGAHSFSFHSSAFDSSFACSVGVSQAALSAPEQAVLDRVLHYNKITGGNYQTFSTVQSGAFPSGTVLTLEKKAAVQSASPYLYLISASEDKLQKPSSLRASTTADGKLAVPLSAGGSYFVTDQSISNLAGKSSSSSGSSSDRDTLLEASEVKPDLKDSKKGDLVSFDVRSEYNVCYDVFHLMKKSYSNRSIEFEGRGYAWRFKGSEIDVPSELIYMDTRIFRESDYEQEIDDLVGRADYDIFTLRYSGKLPGKAGLMLQPEISASKYYLYRYNPSKDRLELLYSDLKEDSSGYVKFVLTHSYDYVLTDSQVKGAYTGSALNSSSSSSSSASSSHSSPAASNPSTGTVTPVAPSAPSSSSSSESSSRPESSPESQEPSSEPQEEPSSPEQDPGPDEPVVVPGEPDAPGPSIWLYVAIGVAVLAALGLAIAVGITIGRRRDD